ncbi:MAG: T9SS type A sorting domain-containing protein, partial [bacterium]
GCIEIYLDPPEKYGIAFDLGQLQKGRYEVYMEDSIYVDQIYVYDVLTLNGSITVMKNPFSRMMTVAIPDVPVYAVPEPVCSWYLNDVKNYDTVKTISDASGAFTMELTNTGMTYKISAAAQGYYNQTIYQAGNLNIASPQSISFELLKNDIEALTDVQILVENNGKSVPDADVTLYAGEIPVDCYMLNKTNSSNLLKTVLDGKTGSDGKVEFADVNLSPFIDYICIISKNEPGHYISKHDTIRLNKFSDNTFTMDITPTEIVTNNTSYKKDFLTISPNPFQQNTTIVIPNHDKSKHLSIYDIKGRLVQNFKDIKTDKIIWKADNLPNGLYILKARIGNRYHSKKLFLQR